MPASILTLSATAAVVRASLRLERGRVLRAVVLNGSLGTNVQFSFALAIFAIRPADTDAAFASGEQLIFGSGTPPTATGCFIPGGISGSAGVIRFGLGYQLRNDLPSFLGVRIDPTADTWTGNFSVEYD